MKKRSLVWFNVAIVLLAFGLTGFGLPDLSKKITPSGGGFPGVDLTILPDIAINQLAAFFYGRKVEDARRKAKVVSTKTELYQQVDKVFKDLQKAAEQSKKYGKAAKKLKGKWKLHIINSENAEKDTNAFAWPGGKVLVYTPMLGLSCNKAGVAAILGHEMVHALAGHVSDRLNKGLKDAGVVAVIMKNPNPNVAELAPKTQVAILASLGVGGALKDRAFSRKYEFGADEGGLRLVAEAGYSLVQANKFWKRLLVKDGFKFEYFNTHPNDEKRKGGIEKAVSKLEKMKFKIDSTKSDEILKQVPKIMDKEGNLICSSQTTSG